MKSINLLTESLTLWPSMLHIYKGFERMSYIVSFCHPEMGAVSENVVAGSCFEAEAIVASKYGMAISIHAKRAIGDDEQTKEHHSTG